MARFLTLNIGASRATLAEYALRGKDSLVLSAYGDADISAAGDLSGSLSATLVPAIQQIMREKGIKPAPLVVSMNGQAVFPRFAKFPPVADEKLAELVRYEVEQNVPFPADEIISDYHVTGETPEGDKAAMIVAAKSDQVRAVTGAVAEAGLSPRIVDVSPMALYNAFRWSNPDAGGCSIILDVGSRTTSLILVEDEKIYTRSIPVAGNAITKEIAQAFGCSIDDAEQTKLERAYVSLGGVTEDADEVADRISKIARTVLTRLHAEISRSVNFYRSQQGGNAPVRLFLTGGTSRLPQMDEFFRETLQVEVGYLNPFSRISLGPKVDREAFASDAFTLAESAGLALRMTDMAPVKINLMPPEILARERNVKRIPYLAAGAVCLLAALGAGIVAENGRCDMVDAQIECYNAANRKLKSADAKLKAATKDAEAALAESDGFQKLLASRSLALRRIKAVREALIPDETGSPTMWIVSWEQTKNRDDETEGARITIRGWRDVMSAVESKFAAETRQTATAAELVQRTLKKCPLFVADSISIDAAKDVRDSLSEFTIKLAFAAAPSLSDTAEKPGDAKKKKGSR